MKKITYILALLMTSSAIAHAEQPKYTGGMKYTSMRPAQPGDSDKKALYNRITPKDNNSTENEDSEATSEEPTEQTAEESVWEKYKELASGQAPKPENKEGTALPKAPKAPSRPQKQASNEDSQGSSGTGLTGLIQEYQRNKAKRSQMRTISFNKPTAPNVDTPSVETPEVETPEER